jgi:hypothetical protein
VIRSVQLRTKAERRHAGTTYGSAQRAVFRDDAAYPTCFACQAKARAKRAVSGYPILENRYKTVDNGCSKLAWLPAVDHAQSRKNQQDIIEHAQCVRSHYTHNVFCASKLL